MEMALNGAPSSTSGPESMQGSKRAAENVKEDVKFRMLRLFLLPLLLTFRLPECPGHRLLPALFLSVWMEALCEWYRY